MTATAVVKGTSTTTTTQTTSSSLSVEAQDCAAIPAGRQTYKLLNRTQLSRDSCLLRFQLPDRQGILGTDPTLPTCLKLDYPNGTDKITGQHPVVLSKSYSPISHPSVRGYFELVVKEYPLQEPGGGVGAFLCHLVVGRSVTGQLKTPPRPVHGSPAIQGRWDHVGLVAGGTGIAPLLQLARILLAGPSDAATRIHILSIHRQDILMHEELDRLAAEYPDRVFLTYSLTGEPQRRAPAAAAAAVDRPPDDEGDDTDASSSCENRTWWRGRGSVEMARAALPPSTRDGKTMIFVCGKDGFVSTWAGPVVRGSPQSDGSKGPKLQGPLLGILASSGYHADEIFKY